MSFEAGFRIGDREILPMEGRITGPAGVLRVEPKAMAVLVELARQAPEVCTRDQIVQRVWPRGYVSDDVLTRCIGQLRRALGDDPKSPTCLETLPRRGYRLSIAAVPCEAVARPETLAARRGESLIVLPFQNLTATGDDLIADGLTELLILRLAALKGIRVISRTTAMHFKSQRLDIGEIAARLHVEWIVEGSVLHSGDRLQVVAQLIDARTDAHIWAADYLRDLQDLLSLQNEIARRIAAAIRLQLGADDETPALRAPMSPPAMRAYLRGRHLVSRRTVPDLRAAQEALLLSTRESPDHASDWASLAECEMLLAHYGAADPSEILVACEDHLERALTLDPDLAIGLSTRGAVRFFFKGDLRGAAADLERALSLLPSYSLAMVARANVCAVQRQFDEAAAWMDQALLVDPLDVGINMNIGDHRILQRRYDLAITAFEQTLEIAPAHRPSRLRLCWALALAGRPQEAERMLQAIAPQQGDDAQWHEYAALVAGAGGDRVTALRHLEELREMGSRHAVSAWTMARAAAAAGDCDAAVSCVQAAAAQRSSSVPFMLVTPALDALHSDARFLRLGASLGLT